ncbi:hypothetical protein M0802_000887 [Mischocyttarus mexicanus]|nr:hypothetical protein M0802_000887 [Mischocyttarus mexicanus]
MCDPNINQACSSLPCGPWSPCDGSKFAIKLCTCKPKPCSSPARIYCVSSPPLCPAPPPCPPPFVPLPPICGIYKQAIRKIQLPCPPPNLPRYRKFGYPPVPPCPPPCPPSYSQTYTPSCPTRKSFWPVCLQNS